MPLDGIVMDIGVSSMQLDEADRGFSFRFDGPLDMRMGGGGPSAADIVAHASETTLANIIFQFGEERHSRRIARAIVAERTETPITTTRQLAAIVSRVVRSKPGDIIPPRAHSRRCGFSSMKSWTNLKPRCAPPSVC